MRDCAPRSSRRLYSMAWNAMSSSVAGNIGGEVGRFVAAVVVLGMARLA